MVSAAPAELHSDLRAHRVLCYRVAPQLVDAAGKFVVEAIAAGGAAVLCGDRAQLRAIEEWSALCGADVRAARAQGRYQLAPLDGEGSGAIGSGLRDALARIPPDVKAVHVFDGAVAPLWERGDVAAALAVEQECESRCAELGASVLCAYPEALVGELDGARSACSEHAATIDAPAFPASRGPRNGWVASAVLPPTPAACSAARRLVKGAIGSDVQPSSTYIPELVVSELSANAVLHARSTFEVAVSLRDGAIGLAVTDASPTPEPWAGFPIATTHGLGIVSTLALEWGVEQLDEGKVVWAEVPCEEAT
jgi:hypothetical protein